MKELLGWSLDGALDPWSCFLFSWLTNFIKHVKRDISIKKIERNLNYNPCRNRDKILLGQISTAHLW